LMALRAATGFGESPTARNLAGQEALGSEGIRATLSPEGIGERVIARLPLIGRGARGMHTAADLGNVLFEQTPVDQALTSIREQIRRQAAGRATVGTFPLLTGFGQQELRRRAAQSEGP
jgi:hypothetical protein